MSRQIIDNFKIANEINKDELDKLISEIDKSTITEKNSIMKILSDKFILDTYKEEFTEVDLNNYEALQK